MNDCPGINTQEPGARGALISAAISRGYAEGCKTAQLPVRLLRKIRNLDYGAFPNTALRKEIDDLLTEHGYPSVIS